MKTKTCPYCGNELSGEAVLCKFCHNLLIDEDGKMTSEGGVGDETKVFKKPDPDDDMTKRFVLPENAKNSNSDVSRGNNGNGGRKKSAPVIDDERETEDFFANDDFDDFDDGYDDDYEEDSARKRLFIITAVITVGVLIIVIAAILIGMRLFGKKGNDNGADNAGAARPAATSAVEQQPQDQTPVDDGIEDEPAATTPDNGAAQPTESAAAVESAAQSTESGADTSSQSDTDSSAVNFAEPGDSSSAAQSGDGTSSQASDSSSQAEVDISDLENTVRTAVAGEINGDITGSQFRSEENGYAYYYFFTDNGAHGYSVAYNIATGNFVCDQNY